MKSVSKKVLSSKAKYVEGVLKQHLPAEDLLHLVDVVHDASQALCRVWNRQQVVEKAAIVAGPGKVLGKKPWGIASEESFQAFEGDHGREDDPRQSTIPRHG